MKKTRYSVHPSVTMVGKWVASLPKKTGRSLEEWIALVKKDGPPDEAPQRIWLKEKHKLGTNSAWWIASRVAGKEWEDGDPAAYLRAAEGYVETMFAGSEAGLRPIYDALLDVCLNFAPDVKACPCQTIVPLYRNHVFAQIKPTTRTRIDFGFALKDTPATGKLIDTGGFAKKDRITHRMEIKGPSDIDAELKRWLKVAYEMDA